MAGLARASSRVPGRKARPLAAAGRPPGRIALPTRVDIVERQEATWLGPGRGRHSCGTAPEWFGNFTGFATWRAARQSSTLQGRARGELDAAGRALTGRADPGDLDRGPGPELRDQRGQAVRGADGLAVHRGDDRTEIGRASCRERV